MTPQSPTDAVALAELQEVAASARRVYERVHGDLTGHLDMTGSCAHATILLCSMVKQFSRLQTTFRGGDGRVDGGYFDACGQGHGHYWLEVSVAGTPYVVDITADQFGAPPVIVTPAERNPHYFPGHQATVDAALYALRDECQALAMLN